MGSVQSRELSSITAVLVISVFVVTVVVAADVIRSECGLSAAINILKALYNESG